eukprot:TRINITY_DN67761_c0_g1_i1.p1 TRINITY_DN67761_c0_g1~~TRINITY_DN67761_c0_g1_i1.p1  ORF type:complete len:615 (+),score=127.83 TRINITY_DN67761_c0_g1_i1:137-1846(+)
MDLLERAEMLRALLPAPCEGEDEDGCPKVVPLRSAALPQYPLDAPDGEAAYWRQWAGALTEALPEGCGRIAAVFAGESYAQRLAEEFGAACLLMPRDDLACEPVAKGISGTRLRDDPLRFWDWIPAPLKSRYVLRVCIPDRADLCGRVAEVLETSWCQRYRPPTASLRGEAVLAPGETSLLVAGQLSLERVMRERARKVLLCEADVVTLQVERGSAEGLSGEAADFADLYILDSSAHQRFGSELRGRGAAAVALDALDVEGEMGQALEAVRALLRDPLAPVQAPTSVWRRIAETWRGDVLETAPGGAKVVVKGSATTVDGASEVLALPDGRGKVRKLCGLLRGLDLASAFGPHFADLDARRVRRCWEEARRDLGLQALNVAPQHYVDLGCGKGDKTVQVSRNFGLSDSQVIGYEVLNTGYEITCEPCLTEITFRKFDGRRLRDEADASVELITCIMSLHHAAWPEDLVKEIVRVLAPTGVVVLKEHDCPDGQGEVQWWSSYLDLYHRSFTAIVTPSRPFELLASYRSRLGWRRAFESAGLRLSFGFEEYEDANMRSYFDAFVHAPSADR